MRGVFSCLICKGACKSTLGDLATSVTFDYWKSHPGDEPTFPSEVPRQDDRFYLVDIGVNQVLKQPRKLCTLQRNTRESAREAGKGAGKKERRAAGVLRSEVHADTGRHKCSSLCISVQRQKLLQGNESMDNSEKGIDKTDA